MTTIDIHFHNDTWLLENEFIAGDYIELIDRDGDLIIDQSYLNGQEFSGFDEKSLSDLLKKSGKFSGSTILISDYKDYTIVLDNPPEDHLQILCGFGYPIQRALLNPKVCNPFFENIEHSPIVRIDLPNNTPLNEVNLTIDRIPPNRNDLDFNGRPINRMFVILKTGINEKKSPTVGQLNAFIKNENLEIVGLSTNSTPPTITLKSTNPLHDSYLKELAQKYPDLIELVTN